MRAIERMRARERERGGAEPSLAENEEHIRVEVAERARQLAEERDARAVVEAAEVALELGGAVPRLQPHHFHCYLSEQRFHFCFETFHSPLSRWAALFPERQSNSKKNSLKL